ncbi:MAG TPA: hypothetical protein VIM58_09035 [Candidatus Methylacidiphilales bacterium]
MNPAGTAQRRRKSGREAFSLLEAAVAIGLTGFCVIAMIGLLPVGLRSNQSSIQQASAGAALFAVASDLFATPAGSSTSPALSPQFKIPVPAASAPQGATLTTLYFVGDGRWSTTIEKDSQYRLVISSAPNATGLRKTVLISLRITWPATAPAEAASTGSVETFVALNRS